MKSPGQRTVGADVPARIACARRYEHSEARCDSRTGHGKLQTKAGEVRPRYRSCRSAEPLCQRADLGPLPKRPLPKPHADVRGNRRIDYLRGFEALANKT